MNSIISFFAGAFSVILVMNVVAFVKFSSTPLNHNEERSVFETFRNSRQLNEEEESTPLEKKTQSEPCALLFFGLARRFPDIVFPFLKKNVLDVNPTCDVYVHTYNVTHILGRGRQETGEGELHVEDIYLLADTPDTLMIETEEDFRKKWNLTYYRTFFPTGAPGLIYPDNLDNMLRQWHSVEQVWRLMLAGEKKRNKRYERIGLFRSDLRFIEPIDITDGDAVIPAMMYLCHRKKGWCGINERIFYGIRRYAEPWAMERYSSVEEYIDYQKGREEYRKKKGLHGEDFMRWLLTVKLKIPFVEKQLCFNRVRTSGLVLVDDCIWFKKRKRGQLRNLALPGQEWRDAT